MERRIFLMLATVAALIPFVAEAHEYKVGDLEIEHPWTRATPKAAEVAAGFLKITNHGDQPDRLIAASSAICDVGQIHTMVIENDVMKMQELKDGLEIPAGATVELKPKSFHVMFIGLRQELLEGGTIENSTVTLPALSNTSSPSVEAAGAQGMDM